MPKRRQLRSFDLKKIEGFESLIGVDEAGRGALAGPVVAGAVLVTRGFLEGRWAATKAGRVNDSKLLSGAQREALWAEFEALASQGQIHAHYGSASVEEIEEHNILGATKLAMRRAMEGIYPAGRLSQERGARPLLVARGARGLRPRRFVPRSRRRTGPEGFPYPHTAMVRGDARSLCVAMASIVAKVARDRMMAELDRGTRATGSRKHKGYGTDEHRDAVSGWAGARSTGRCSCASCSPIARTRTRWTSFPAVDPRPRWRHNGR